MAEVLVTPDVEAAVCAYLPGAYASNGIPGVRVGTRTPSPLVPPFVKVVLTGGVDLNMVTDVAQVTLEYHGADEVRASELARKGHALMRAAEGAVAGGVWVRRVETVGLPQNLPDPDAGTPRYVSTVRWRVRPV